MPVTINGGGSIEGLSVGGLGSGVVNDTTLASNAVTTAKIASGAVTAVKHGAGSVIQCVTDTTTAKTDNNGNSYVEISGLSVTMTPRASNSKFYAIFEGHFYVNYGGSGSNNAHGIGYNIYKDGVRFTTSPVDNAGSEAGEKPYDWYSDGPSRTVARLMKTGQGTFGSTSAATFTVKFKGYYANSTHNISLNENNSAETQAQLTVMEIAV